MFTLLVNGIENVHHVVCVVRKARHQCISMVNKHPASIYQQMIYVAATYIWKPAIFLYCHNIMS